VVTLYPSGKLILYGGDEVFKWEKNYPRLSKEIDDSGLKIAHVAKSAGLAYGQLYRRLTNEIDFELPVMRKISKLLGISMDALFNDKKI
jgi:predicted transcriptional regulator